MDDLDTLTIEQRLAAYKSEAEGLKHEAAVAETGGKNYRYVSSLSEAASRLVEYLQNQDGRIMLGLPQVDMLTRGFGAGELTYIMGYTHSGKTQLFLTMVCHNRDRHFVLVTMDEPAELVLTKLICMRTSSNAERLEERVKAGDRQAIDRVHRIAREDFKNLVIVDMSMHVKKLPDVVKECEDFWQAPVDGLGLDYLGLLGSDDIEIGHKSQEVKAFAVEQAFPTVVIHQGSRGNSADGQELTMRSMAYGGEQEAIMVIGVRRQRDKALTNDWTEYDRAREKDTVEVSVVKNKRPPSKLGEYSFYMDPACGLIMPLDQAPQ